jgi:hypothetical protein
LNLLTVSTVYPFRARPTAIDLDSHQLFRLVNHSLHRAIPARTFSQQLKPSMQTLHNKPLKRLTDSVRCSLITRLKPGENEKAHRLRGSLITRLKPGENEKVHCLRGSLITRLKPGEMRRLTA